MSTTNRSAWKDPYRAVATCGNEGASILTYVGVRRGDGAAQTRVSRRRHLVVHVVAVAHVVARAGAVLDVPPKLELELPGRLHERGPRRARCGPGPCAGRTCAKPPAAPPPDRSSACRAQRGERDGAGARRARDASAAAAGAADHATARIAERPAAGRGMPRPPARPSTRATRPRRRPELHVTARPTPPLCALQHNDHRTNLSNAQSSTTIYALQVDSLPIYIFITLKGTVLT